MSNIQSLDFTMPEFEMTRRISTHEIPVPYLEQVQVLVPIPGEHYTVRYFSQEEGFAHHILFQHGETDECGVNGVTVESLLAILIDKLECDMVNNQEGSIYQHRAYVALKPLRKTLSNLRDLDMSLYSTPSQEVVDE